MPSFELGASIPPDTAHAVSVSLPTWSANVGYEEGDKAVVDRMTTGYPRFFVHKSIQAFADDIATEHGQPDQMAVVLPSKRVANRCLTFIRERAPADLTTNGRLAVIHLTVKAQPKDVSAPPKSVPPGICALLFPRSAFPYAKQYWQHTGEGTSSRRAEFYHGLFKEGLLAPEECHPSATPLGSHKLCRGPRRYQRPMSVDEDGAATPTLKVDSSGSGVPSADGTPAAEAEESSRFLEERFGRNLDLSFVDRAKSAIRRRIAGALTSSAELGSGPLSPMSSNSRGIPNLREGDIYLFPAGMNAIFNTHQILLQTLTPQRSVNFGFPYVDTLKVLEKFGPGCQFYGHGSESDLDDLEKRLSEGERFLAFFCEFPGNPLLLCPNLGRIRKLADEYGFALVVDESIGNFRNINVLPFADVVVSSLTKIFSGDCNVMGGSAILNPNGRYYSALKATMAKHYEDNYWPEDVIFMERNSRDFISRIERINANAVALVDLLTAHPMVKRVYYPQCNDTRPNYEVCRTPTGGYGGLFSVALDTKAQAVAFFDALETAKGPSLGTNFTLTSPYVLLAHYQELEWAASFGVNPDLIRVSVGLESTEELITIFTLALKAAEKFGTEA